MSQASIADMKDAKLTLYTDGACSQTTGGFGSILVRPDTKQHIKFGGGPYKDTTNNQMEMMAVIAGLEFAHTRMGPQDLLVISDSKYVINGITEWIHGWKRNGWFTSAGKVVKNESLWKRMEAEVNRHRAIEFKWVKGHNGNEFNEMADQIAVAYRESDIEKLTVKV